MSTPVLSNTWARPKGAHRRHYYRDGVPICGASWLQRPLPPDAEPQAEVPIHSARCRRCTCRWPMVSDENTRRITSRCALERDHAGPHFDADRARRLSELASEMGRRGGLASGARKRRDIDYMAFSRQGNAARRKIDSAGAVAMRQAGATLQQIADRYGVTVSGVSYSLRRSRA